jgi:DNA-binding response OmpR family regulator
MSAKGAPQLNPPSRARSIGWHRHGEAASRSIPGPRLLVVQDHKKTAQVLARELEAMGYVSDISGTAAQTRAALEIGNYVALVLDLDLQGGDGLAVLREIRQREDPIAVITISARNSVHDRINVLRSGADDCLAKPFSYGELVARLETVLRRYDHRFAPLQVANLVFDPVSRQTFVDQRLQKLSRRQTAVLGLLVRRQGRVLPKALVERELFGRKSSSTSNAIDVYIHRLRKRLADSGAKVQVRAIRGVGYVMSDESSRRLINLAFDAASPQAFVDRWLQILSAREAKVLELLTRKPGSIVPKKLLERQLFGRDDSSTANAIDVYIHRLRKKLIERGANVQIRTVFGAGYRIVEQDRDDRC